MQHHLNHTSLAETNIFSDLFDTYYARLTLFAFRYVNDRDIAEDIVQECFVRIWERREIFPLENINAAYLYGAVRKKTLCYLRDKKYMRPVTDEEPVFERSDIMKLVEAETYAELFKAMESLPSKCRDIFSMIYKEEKSFREIAAELNITESTIRTQKAKGLRLLRKKLQWLITFVILWLMALFS